MSTVSDRVEAAVLRTAMSLPPRLQQALAGAPVVIDGQTLARETQLMLRLQRVARVVAAETLPVLDGRRVIDHQATMTGGRQPVGSVRDVDAGGVPARLYTPTGAASSSPIVLFLHGGGFVFGGGFVSHDASCRVVAERAGVRVLAVDYRQGPEDPFPAAHDDAVAAYRWLVENAASLGGDPERIGVMGDSAGGTLSIAVAFAAARDHLPLKAQILVYPATDMAHATRSYELFGEGFFLTRAFMDLANESYYPESDPADPEVSAIHADIPDGVAPAYVCTAGFDPLRDEGEAFARKLQAAGVPVRLSRFPGQIHGFFNIVGVGSQARVCVDEIADAVRDLLA